LQEGDVVMDLYSGSGTFSCAAILTGRRFIAFEDDAESVKIAEARTDHAKKEASLL